MGKIMGKIMGKNMAMAKIMPLTWIFNDLAQDLAKILPKILGQEHYLAQDSWPRTSCWAGDPKHLESSWVLIENGGQVTPCDVLGVRPLDLYLVSGSKHLELERMQSKRIASICGIFTATTFPNPHPASSSSSPSLNSHPNSQLVGTLVPSLVIGGIPLSSSDMDPLLLDLLADVDQVRVQARRMLYKSRRPHSHPPKRHRSFSNLEDLREDDEDKMAAQDRLLKYPSAFDLQSYHLSRVVADASMARSKLSEFMDAIKRFSLINWSGAEETELDGEQPTNPLSSTKRWLSDSNMLDEVGGKGNKGNSLYVPLAISSNARPTSFEAILDSTRTDISAGEGGARERPDSVSSMATLTESSRRVGGAIGEEEREGHVPLHPQQPPGERRRRLPQDHHQDPHPAPPRLPRTPGGRSSSDALSQQQQQQQLLQPTSSTDNSRPSSISGSSNLHGQPVTYLEARHIVLKMLAIASNHSKMQHDLSTSRTISLLTSCLGDPFEENVTNGIICLANLAQNVDSHPLLVQAKLAEKLGGVVFDGLRTRFHAAKVSRHIASHTRSCPHFQGTIETPSGRFPSERYRPEGSKRNGTCAETKALCMISFTAEWRRWRPALFLQLKPCVAN
eukprot:Em0003g482a